MNTVSQNYQTNRLYKTTDYSIFIAHDHNRPIRDSQTLLASMKKYGFLSSSPVHCVPSKNGKLSLVRGHHRLHYAKMLKIPVWFVVNSETVDIYDLEGSSSSSWDVMDFATSRAMAGEKSYQDLAVFAKTTRLPIGVAASLFSGESAGNYNARHQVKNGSLKKGDQSHAEDVMRMLDACDAASVPFSRLSSFVAAISSVLRIPELSHDTLERKLRSHGGRMRRVGTRNNYIEEIERTYNHGSHARLPIAIRAHEVGLKRKSSFGRES